MQTKAKRLCVGEAKIGSLGINIARETHVFRVPSI
jgi:hypothetical protein